VSQADEVGGQGGPDEVELLVIAREAAYAAAAELMSRFGRVAQDVHTKSTPTDPASEADLEAEAVVRRLLAERRPQDAILGEEEGATGEGELRWLVDPLDGTVNFLFGIPAFAVSVACEDASGALAGVVLDPIRDECFAATRSGQATLNGEPICGSWRSDLATALVATGFGYDAAVRARQARVAARVLPRARDIRRFGAAALDLAWCACGRWDAYYERGVKPWDVAAGALICRRAGLSVRRLEPVGEDPVGLVVAPEGLVEELFRLVTE
jgi:myo-inositol-1(or 4)-monophosphatase